MKILAINSIKYNNNHEHHIQNTAKNATQPIQNGVYNPIYYKDYNIQLNFGKRSPEDFYAQDFNRENLPKRMKEYLNENFAERSKIAPVQIMQEAYDDLSVASTVEDIKELFPNGREPKFDKLRPAVYTPSKNGILGKIGTIKAMQDAPEPLFKDGCDDLTTYLVKKIYLEGKTVKEIDKDFAKDINEVYELAAKVPDEAKKTLGKNESAYFSHSTVYGLGIRFPEVPFWNSFIATRDDYERTARVKTKNGFVNANDIDKTPKTSNTVKAEAPEKPRRYKFQREKIKKLTDIIINTNEGSQKALKEVKRRGGRNEEELTFLQKYWSEIMTLATEKIHLSEEMIDFNATRNLTQEKINGAIVDKFVTGQEFTKREKTPLKIFWDQRPNLKEYFSQSITDVIMQFTDAYGADGENSYFKALLNDAHTMKPMRELARIRHEEIQAEYDEMGRQLMEAEKPESSETKAIVEEVKSAVEELKEAAEPEFKYVINGEEITTGFDIKAKTYEFLDQDFRLIPHRLYSTYKREFNEAIKENPELFYLSYTADPDVEDETLKKLLLSKEKKDEINTRIITVMEDEHNSELESCRLALMKVAEKHGLVTNQEISNFAGMDILRIQDAIIKKLPEGTNLETMRDEIDKAYKEITKPITKKEHIKIRQDLLKYISSYKEIDTTSATTCIRPMIKLLALGSEFKDETLKDGAFKDMLKGLLSNQEIVKIQGPSMRYILEEGGNEMIKDIIREHSLRTIISGFTQECAIIMQSRPKEMETLLARFPEELSVIKQYATRALLAVSHIK